MHKEKRYSRMTWIDRLNIEKLFNAGASYRAMPRKLGFSVSSLHYEVQRGLYDHLDSKNLEHPKTLFRHDSPG